MTLEELKKIMPASGKRAALFLDALNETMMVYEIDTPERQAAFLSQIAHESMSLLYTEEIATGHAYEGREDLGNTEVGDGVKFKGHGLLQLTGRDNHQRYADHHGMSLDDTLVYLQTIEGATDVAGWFWWTHDLNKWADRGDFKRITRIINGGFNGYQDRLAYYERAKSVLV